MLLLALMSTLGNVASLTLRRCFRRRSGARSEATSVFVSHLSACNGVMGLYLAMLTAADHVHGGHYLWADRAWRSSPWCIVYGFLFLLSSQVSVFLVTMAALERCWVLSRPHDNVKTRKVSMLLCFVSWVAGVVLASMPAARASFGSSGACIPPLVPLPGQQHVHHASVSVLLVLNGVLMLLTLVGQGYIYTTACRNEMTLIVDREGSRNLILALRMMTISVTDACSWFVVVGLVLLTSHGVVTSGDVSFTSTMLTMVTKPSCNPYLYLLSVFLERRRQTLQQRLLQWLRKTGTTK